MIDEYAGSGEFLDLLIGDAWTALRGPVVEALRGIDPAAGPLVDLGAGSGRGVRLLTELAPRAAVHAVEPSPVLRAALLTRLADDPALRDRVSVVAGRAETAPLPDRLGGVLAMNMIGHLAPHDRRRLWRSLADRLAPGAPLVLNLQPPERPEPVPETVFTTVRVGSHTYEGAGRAEPDGAGSVVWHMSYRVRDEHGTPLREITTGYRWHVLDPPALLAELAAVGLTAAPLDGGVFRAIREAA